MRKTLAIFLAGMLAACGGGGSPAPQRAAPQYQTRMMVSADTPVQNPGFNASASFPPDADPAASIAKQAAMPGEVTVTMLPFKDTRFERLDQWIAVANTYPQVKGIYVYDELFWSGSQIELGAHDAEVSAAARRVKRAGLKSSVSIMPDVVLEPGFALSDPNAFSIIMVDVYPSLLLPGGGATTSPCVAGARNPYTAILACSVQKLRAIGFTGEVWYVYQAFGHSGDPNLMAEMQQQAQTIADGPALGVTGLVQFGYFNDGGFAAPLYPGRGSALERFITLN